MSKAPTREKKILDATCGGRMMWFDKAHPNVLYVDKRYEPKGFMTTRPSFEVAPDVQASFTDLPFKANTFHMVVYDPPHTVRKNDSGGFIAQRYGRLLMSDWEETIAKGFEECWRVLKKNGTLVFKWCEVDIPIESLESFYPDQPLYGSRLGKNNKTIWLVFMKL